MPPSETGVGEEKTNYSGARTCATNCIQQFLFDNDPESQADDVDSLQDKIITAENELRLMRNQLQRATEGARIKSARLQREATCNKMCDFIKEYKNDKVDEVDFLEQSLSSMADLLTGAKKVAQEKEAAMKEEEKKRNMAAFVGALETEKCLVCDVGFADGVGKKDFAIVSYDCFCISRGSAMFMHASCWTDWTSDPDQTTKCPKCDDDIGSPIPLKNRGVPRDLFIPV